MLLTPQRSSLFPYTTLFRSLRVTLPVMTPVNGEVYTPPPALVRLPQVPVPPTALELKVERRRRHGKLGKPHRSEEHTSELQSHVNLVCHLRLEKKQL